MQANTILSETSPQEHHGADILPQRHSWLD
jgi:hypothetical protein